MTEMIKQYLETALWSSTNSDGDPLDAHYTIDAIAPDSVEQARKDLDAFVARAALIPGTEDLDVTDLAHDFWLTRNGHGAGFWDGDYDKQVGEALTIIAETFGPCEPYVGDDNLIHMGV